MSCVMNVWEHFYRVTLKNTLSDYLARDDADQDEISFLLSFVCTRTYNNDLFSILIFQTSAFALVTFKHTHELM